MSCLFRIRAAHPFWLSPLNLELFDGFGLPHFPHMLSGTHVFFPPASLTSPLLATPPPRTAPA
eukprot:8074416-Pyramimonas_sp.AAC.1